MVDEKFFTWVLLIAEDGGTGKLFLTYSLTIARLLDKKYDNVFIFRDVAPCHQNF